MPTVDEYRTLIGANVSRNIHRLESGRGSRQYLRRMGHLRSRTSRLREAAAAAEGAQAKG